MDGKQAVRGKKLSQEKLAKSHNVGDRESPFPPPPKIKRFGITSQGTFQSFHLPCNLRHHDCSVSPKITWTSIFVGWNMDWLGKRNYTSLDVSNLYGVHRWIQLAIVAQDSNNGHPNIPRNLQTVIMVALSCLFPASTNKFSRASKREGSIFSFNC